MKNEYLWATEIKENVVAHSYSAKAWAPGSAKTRAPGSAKARAPGSAKTRAAFTIG